ncbi:MAG: FAD-dependent oxidoreductase [Bacteroidetes bacterium]|nr:FAD-dependent oxidoreductase [Bacteroidota bacterium]
MNKKVAIIGAGISGLSLGYYLSKKKLDVTVFEKEKEVGGLLSTIEVDKSIRIEKFYHHVFPSDKEFIELFDKLGISEDLRWYKSSNSIFVDNKFLPFSKISDYLKFPELNLLSKIRLLVGGYILSKKKLTSIDKLKAEIAIKKYMGKKSWDKIWGPLFYKKFGEDTKDILASWFWWRLNAKLGSSGKEILGYPKGGFSKFIKVIIKEILNNGGKIVSNVAIKKVFRNKGGYEVNGDHFDNVFFTIPATEINKIYNNAKVEEIKYKAAINLILVLKNVQTKWYWNNIPELDIPFVGVIEHTNLVGRNDYNNKTVLYLTQYIDKKDITYINTDDEIFKKYKKYFKEIGILDSNIVSYFVSVSDYAQPVLIKKPTRVGFQKIDKNMYKISMEDIYPEDRGINQAIKYAKQLADIIS